MDERKTHPKEKQRTKEKLKNPKEEQGTKEKDIASGVFRNEDIAQKKASIFFGKELLSLYGISGKIVSAAPTELADITISNLYQDYNYVMEDGSWKHLEFESTDIDEDDLRRFRAYEALASYQYKVDITTYVICSAKVKRPHCKLQSGLSTYQIVPICLGDREILFQNLTWYSWLFALLWEAVSANLIGSKPLWNSSKTMFSFRKKKKKQWCPYFMYWRTSFWSPRK